MVHVYYDLVLQGMRFRVVQTGVLGLGLIMVHVSYDVVLQGIKGLGLFEREY
jgi:hypothetical protein